MYVNFRIVMQSYFKVPPAPDLMGIYKLEINVEIEVGNKDTFARLRKRSKGFRDSTHESRII